MTEHKFGTWYPIEELRDREVDVLVCFLNGGMCVGYKSFPSGEIWNDCGTYTMEVENVMGWMPLPPPPGETND